MLPGGRIAVAVIGALAIAAPAAASATTITVNDTGDAAADDGVCQLREAITSANGNFASGSTPGECAAGQADPTEDVIEFDITGAGPHVIEPSTDLPDIDEVATIDGASDGTDEIALDGAPNDVAFGLRLDADGAVIDSLSIYGFATGVVVTDPDGSVLNSFIGTNEAGAVGIGNDTGISLSSSDGLARGNLISGNSSDGVRVFSTGNVVAGNLIGTNQAGIAALANGSGIEVAPSADSVTIGGPNPADANLVSGNSGPAITLSRSDSTDPMTGVAIEGNRIGTRIGGQVALPNTGGGIGITGNVTGTTITDNLISGNGADGIALAINVVQPMGAPGPSQNTIAGNSIGTDIDGDAAVPNGGEGISISGNASHPATGNVIGGTTGLTPGGSCTGDCNLIAANGQDGIQLGDPSTTGTQVLGNYVGTDLTGTVSLGNGFNGINLAGASGGSIGSPAGPNLVSGNGTDGISLSQASSGNDVQANLIGVDSGGTDALANDGAGVFLNGTDTDGNLIGGTALGEGNVIAHNEGEGVAVTFGPLDNAILGNSIAENGDLGINIGADGVTANDVGDGDAGENDLQNFPELEAVVAGGLTIVRGTLNSTASADFRIEVFDNADDDPTGHGEGQTPLGAFDVTTDASGDASFLEVLDGTAGAGNPVSATATELGPLGEPLSTSEFSLDVHEGTCDVTGTSGDDTLSGLGPGADVICGLGGDDEIAPDDGDDAIVGGNGTDDADYSAAVDPLEADLGAGLATLGTQSDVLSGIENVTGTGFDDEIIGDAAENELTGGDGDDTIEGGDGDDTLKGQNGKDTLKSQDGKDEVKGGDKGDTLKGGDGDKDDLDGNDGGDELNGGGGDKDDCNGGSGNDDHDGGCEKKSSL